MQQQREQQHSDYLRYGNPPPPHPRGHHSGPPPAAPLPPRSGQPTPHSTHPPSPTSSSDNLGDFYYNSSPHHLGYAPTPPQAAPAPAQPQSTMRGGDGSIGRRNTTANSRPMIHQYFNQPPPGDYRPQRPIISHHRSSSHPRDQSPDSGPFMVIPGSGGAVHRSQTYRPDSSGYSDGSYESGDIRGHGGQKGYLISAGNNRRAPSSNRDDYKRRSRDAGTLYHLDGPPRRRGGEGSQSRSRLDYDELTEQDKQEEFMRSQGRMLTNNPSASTGALVQRSRSCSDSQGPSSAGGTLVRRGPDNDGDAPPPSNSTIRLEYGGQAIDIAYTGSNGKPLVGNITINTTARTVTVPDPQLSLPAPPTPLALPPGVQPVMIPPPPPATAHSGSQMMALPAPPSRRPPRSERGSDDTDYSHSPSGRDMYRDFANMQIEGPPGHRQHHHQHPPRPPVMQEGPPIRGRPPMMPQAPPAPRAPSRGRAPSQGRGRASSPRAQSRGRAPSNPPPEDPLWTKISRDIVSKRAVLVRGYDFEEVPNAIIIYRVLDEEEIDDLVGLSERIREGKVEVHRQRKPSVSSGGGGGGASAAGNSVARRRSTSRRRPRPMSIHGYPTGPLGPGPSKERPPPGKPAIVHTQRGLPEAPAPPPPERELGMMSRAPAPPPVTVQQTKGLRENPEAPGTYVGYTRKPPRV